MSVISQLMIHCSLIIIILFSYDRDDDENFIESRDSSVDEKTRKLLKFPSNC